MNGLVASAVSVELDQVQILRDVSVSIPQGSITAVLGPSGSGKSTLLRAVAGLVPSSGAMRLDGTDIAPLPTHRRGIGLMFQSHALFPHLSVADNIRFGLTEQGITGPEANMRVQELLELVDLSGFDSRSVTALSGGEAQRVALARALAPRPKLLMLDEPLGSLDRRLRDELTGELAALLGEANTTALYVTHDQEEAAAIADRLLILEAGEVVAEGSAESLWRQPATPWLARFMGHPNVSAAAMIPVPSIEFGHGEHGGVVESRRFADGVWRIGVRLNRPLEEIERIEGTAPTMMAIGSEVRLRIDSAAIVRF